jgi:hypothetical protein
MDICTAFQEFQQKWPAVFRGTELDRMTGNAYRWRNLQNQKARGEVPAEVFLRSGGRDLLVVRDQFLRYWQSKISRA